MTSINLHINQSAKQLPSEWDQLANHYFQKRAFLMHAEKYNPCRQRYYLLFKDNHLLAGAVTYTLSLDLFTFRGFHFRSPVQMHITGIPCSVSCPGIFGSKEVIELLKEEIYKREKGFCLFLNLPDPINAPTRIGGQTLPTIVFQNPFSNWNEYLEGLRTHYRHRLKKITAKGKMLQLESMSCRSFSPQMYKQYLEVYDHSDAKLEKLEFDFFRNLPEPFKLITANRDAQLMGWAITIFSEEQYYFFLGGVDYSTSHEYETYFQLLTAILKDGIALGAKTIDLGQTAEIPKMRLGGKSVARYMEGQHSNQIVHRLLKMGQPWLEYRREVPEHHVLKQMI
jgi:hypothetical protein